MLSEGVYLLVNSIVAILFFAWLYYTRSSSALFVTRTAGWIFIAFLFVAIAGDGDSPLGRLLIQTALLAFLLLTMSQKLTVRDGWVTVRNWFSTQRFATGEVVRLIIRPAWAAEYGESNQRLYVSLMDKSEVDVTHFKPASRLIEQLALAVRSENDREATFHRQQRTSLWICRVFTAIACAGLVVRIVLFWTRG